MQKKIKKRYWTAVVYPESLPTDWIDILKRTGLKIAISPLHDKDLTATKEQKKAHYHLIICYNSPTTFSNVSNLIQGELHGVVPQPVDDINAMYRYFTHLDDPNKYQYSDKDIVLLNNFEIPLKNQDILNIKKEIQNYIIENKIVEYSTLMDKLLNHNRIDWYDVASSNTLFFNNYLKSKRHLAELERQRKNDEFFCK